MLAPGNDHHEPDDGLTEAPREEEEENDEDFAGPPELISSEEEDEQVFIDGMVATLTQNGTSLTPLHIVNGALGRVVVEETSRGQSHQHRLLWSTRECNAVAP